ncbi:uncharacterized protein LOC105180639 [Harpegnathos saltator]|uniref:uncharacterized protein LOC105180639 n=1 Tax=Harpegnathos saltator TaxID=610380 RepID=UPI000DBEED4A|nr:uncharacterized protein LOC105180639 [Harpegnathos saltator]
MGDVRLGEGRVYTLAYADDVAILAEDEEGMKGMMARLEKYFEGKGLEVNREKTKVMRCRKNGGRCKEMDWRWKGKRVEEVKEYKYLGYVVRRSGGQDAQLRDRMKKAAKVMGQV